MSRSALYTSVGRNNTPMYRTLNRALRGTNGICDHGSDVPIFADAPFCLIQPMTIDLGHHMVFVKGVCPKRFESVTVPVRSNQVPVLRKAAALKCIQKLGTDGRIRWRPEDHCDHVNSMIISGPVRRDKERYGVDGRLIHLIMCQRCRTIEEIELFPLDFEYLFEDNFDKLLGQK